MSRVALSRKFVVAALAAAALAIGGASPQATQPHAGWRPTPDRTIRVAPVFVENIGQFNPRVKFYSRAAHEAVFATDRAVTIALAPADGRSLALRLAFLGAAAAVHVRGDDEQAGRVNYFTGRSPADWRTGARTYRRARYADLWPGIDAAVRLDAERLTYDFHVAAGANPSSIRLRYDGAVSLRIGPEGDLTIQTANGSLVDRAPRTYQVIDGRQVTVPSAFVLRGGTEYGIEVGHYDRTRPLVIDPTLVYASYLGSSGADQGHAITIDSSGNAYVTGFTQWIDFPTTAGAFQTILGGNDTNTPKRDAFVTKVNPTASTLIYSTYLGGSDDDEGNAIAVDAGGNAYVTGYTRSTDFPVTAGALQTTPPYGVSAFVTKLNATGSGLLYSTYYGGALGAEIGNGIAVDSSGRAYVVGESESNALPGINGFQTTWASGFSDGFLVRLSAAGSAVEYGTYLGGSGWDVAFGVAVNGTDAFVTGETHSFDFPTTAGVYDPAGELMPRSADGGTTWTVVRGVAANGVFSLAVDPTSSSTVYAGTDGRGVFKSTDGGQTFAAPGGGIPDGLGVNALAVLPSSPSTVYAVTSSGLYKTVDGGATWASSGPDYRYGDVSIDSSTTAVFAAAGSLVIRSTDGGATWTTVQSSAGNSVLADPTRPKTVYVGGTGGIFRSSDDGATWVFVGSGLAGSVTRLRVDTSGTIYAVAGGGLFKSTDGGSSFTTMSGISQYGSMWDAAVDSSTTPASIYAVPWSGNGTTQSIFKSTDGGTTFNRISPRGSQILTNCVTVIAPATVLVGVERSYDAFVTRVNTSATGASSLIYSTHLSGLADDFGAAIAVDGSNDAYAAGSTYSGDFPHSSGAFQPSGAGGWVAKLDATGGVLQYGAGIQQAVHAVAIDGSGAAYVATGGNVGRLSSDGTSYSAYQFGGTAGAGANGVAVDGGSNAYVTGTTTATDFPTTSGVFQPSYGSGASDAFVAKVSFADVAGGGGGGGGTLPSPWTSQDVGSTGVPGSASYANGVFTVAGAGADIWGTSDSFRFVYQPLASDGTIVAHVTSEQNTNTYAKAGIMMRANLDAGSINVVLDVRPDGGIEFMDRTATGGPTTFVAGGTLPFPAWLKLVRTAGTITGSISSDGTNWTTLGSVSTTMTSGQIEVGLVVTSHDTSVTNTSTFDNVSVTLPSSGGGGGLPSPWVANDVGSVGIAGTTSYNNGTFTVKGSGADIWGTADAFQYASQTLGDGQLVARIASEQNTNTYAKAGVMLRETMAADSAHVLLDIKPDGGIEFMTRSTTGGSTMFVADASAAFPAWLKLVRAGSTVTGYLSSDGTTWTTVGSTSTSMAATTNAGLIVTSHDNTVLNTATFDNVAVTPASPPPPPSPANVVIYANDIPSTGVHGSWTPASDSTAAAGVKLVTPDSGVSNTSSALASPTDYVDVSFDAAANTPYTIWLRLQATANSKYNDSVWVQFSDAQVSGSGAYRIGSTNGLLVNLATDGTGSSLNGWGWQNTAYWLSQAVTVTFPASGSHTLRIQVREDGVQFDQIVLSPTTYLTTAPGPPTNDATIVAK